MLSPRVKICGITLLEDAVAALSAGADYLGFILYPPSPRAITPERLATLVAELRADPVTQPRFGRPDPPLLVGVFVNETPWRVAGVLDSCRLDLAQLSGDEQPADLIDPASPLYGRGYKAIRPRTLEEVKMHAARYTNNRPDAIPAQPLLLLDTPHQALYGGTGETGDWSIAAALARVQPGLMLAGGLRPENVAVAVASVRPFAIDVAGGVESAPGRKDHRLVAAFIQNAKRGLTAS